MRPTSRPMWRPRSRSRPRLRGPPRPAPVAPAPPAMGGAALRPAPPPRRPSRWRRLLAGLLALTAVGGVVASPAVGDWLGLRGVRVHQEAGPPVSTLGQPLQL